MQRRKDCRENRVRTRALWLKQTGPNPARLLRAGAGAPFFSARRTRRARARFIWPQAARAFLVL